MKKEVSKNPMTRITTVQEFYYFIGNFLFYRTRFIRKKNGICLYSRQGIDESKRVIETVSACQGGIYIFNLYSKEKT